LEPVPVPRLVEQLHSSLTRLYPDNKVKFSFDIRQRHRVMADPEQLMRVLMNIGENAIQATQQKGHIRIESKQVLLNGRACIDISISNDGPEIAGEDRAKLFSPFFSKKAYGTGLGLAIAKKIVEEHHGDILLSSTSVGTCFTISIPQATNEQMSPTKKTAEGSRTLQSMREQTILIFDDERLVRDHWRKYAKDHSYQTAWEFSSWEDFVSQNGFKLVVGAIAFVDLHYKGSQYDGIEIARSLRDLGVKKIYAITNDPDAANASGLFNAVFGKDIPSNFDQLVG
jgi:hypothetical protein